MVAFAGPLTYKSRMRGPWIVLVIGVVASVWAEELRTIGVEEAVNLALLNNRDILGARLQVDKRELSGVLNRNDFLTTLEPDGSAVYSRENETLFYGMNLSRKMPWGTKISSRAGYEVSKTDDNETVEGGSLRFELSQPLFRKMGRKVTLEPILQAESNFRAVQRALLTRQADIMLEVLRSFEQIILLHQQIASSRRAYERLDALYELSVVREKQGKQNRVAGLRVELQRGQAEVRLQNDEEQLQAEVENLADLVNLDQQVELSLEPPALVELVLGDLDESVAIALEHRLDFAQALDDYRDRDRKLAVAQRRVWPDLQVTTRYELRPEVDGEPFELKDDNWFAGLSLGSAFDVRDEKAVIRQSASSREQAALDIESQRYKVGREVRAAIRAYRRARAAIGITGRNLDLAEKRLELARTLYELRRGDNFSVTDAESALQAAESASYLAASDARLSTYRVKAAMGTLIESSAELKPVPLREPQRDD